MCSRKFGTKFHIFYMQLQGVKFKVLKRLGVSVPNCQCTATRGTMKWKGKNGFILLNYLNNKLSIDTVNITITLVASIIVVSYHPLLLSYTTLTPHSDSRKTKKFLLVKHHIFHMPIYKMLHVLNEYSPPF